MKATRVQDRAKLLAYAAPVASARTKSFRGLLRVVADEARAEKHAIAIVAVARLRQRLANLLGREPEHADAYLWSVICDGEKLRARRPIGWRREDAELRLQPTQAVDRSEKTEVPWAYFAGADDLRRLIDKASAHREELHAALLCLEVITTDRDRARRAVSEATIALQRNNDSCRALAVLRGLAETKHRGPERQAMRAAAIWLRTHATDNSGVFASTMNAFLLRGLIKSDSRFAALTVETIAAVAAKMKPRHPRKLGLFVARLAKACGALDSGSVTEAYMAKVLRQTAADNWIEQ